MNSGGPESRWHRLALPVVHPHHKHPFNCSDTALRVAESIIGEKVIIFAFRQV